MAHVFVVAPHSAPQYTHCDADGDDTNDADADHGGGSGDSGGARARDGSDDDDDGGGLLIALHIPLTAPSRAHGGTQLRDENSRVLAEAWGARGAGYLLLFSRRVFDACAAAYGGYSSSFSGDLISLCVRWLLVVVQRRSPQFICAPRRRARYAFNAMRWHGGSANTTPTHRYVLAIR